MGKECHARLGVLICFVLLSSAGHVWAGNTPETNTSIITAADIQR